MIKPFIAVILFFVVLSICCSPISAKKRRKNLHKQSILSWIKNQPDAIRLAKFAVEPVHVAVSGQNGRASTMKVPIAFKNFAHTLTVAPPGNGPCQPNTRLLIYVLSHVFDVHKRKAIRESWGSNLPQGVRLVFVLGTPPGGKHKIQKKVERANAINQNFGDILQLELPDLYPNLHLKTQALFAWRHEFCSHARFLLKIDDDAIVDVQRLLYWIDREFYAKANEAPGRRAAFGWIIEHAPVFRDPHHKWYVPVEAYAEQFWPPYLYGPVFLLTAEAAEAFGDRRVTQGVNLHPIDDAIMGQLALKGDVRFFHAEDHLRAGGFFNQREPCSEFSFQNLNHQPEPLLIALQVIRASPGRVKRGWNILRTLHCDREGVSNKFAAFPRHIRQHQIAFG